MKLKKISASEFTIFAYNSGNKILLLSDETKMNIKPVIIVEI